MRKEEQEEVGPLQRLPRVALYVIPLSQSSCLLFTYSCWAFELWEFRRMKRRRRRKRGLVAIVCVGEIKQWRTL